MQTVKQAETDIKRKKNRHEKPVKNIYGGSSLPAVEKTLSPVKKATPSVKDGLSIEFLKNCAKVASAEAVNENIALNIPVTYLEDKSIIRQSAKGKKRLIAILDK